MAAGRGHRDAVFMRRRAAEQAYNVRTQPKDQPCATMTTTTIIIRTADFCRICQGAMGRRGGAGAFGGRGDRPWRVVAVWPARRGGGRGGGHRRRRQPMRHAAARNRRALSRRWHQRAGWADHQRADRKRRFAQRHQGQLRSGCKGPPRVSRWRLKSGWSMSMPPAPRLRGWRSICGIAMRRAAIRSIRCRG